MAGGLKILLIQNSHQAAEQRSELSPGQALRALGTNHLKWSSPEGATAGAGNQQLLFSVAAQQLVSVALRLPVTARNALAASRV